MSDSVTGEDRYALYEAAAQSPLMQARFLRALSGAPDGASLTLGEDFSGAGAVSRAFLTLSPRHRAVCVDRDPEPLDRLRQLCGHPDRLVTRVCDAMEAHDSADIIATLNFSICEFHRRRDLVAYFEHARSRLSRAAVSGGLLVLDIYGGADAFALGESDIELRGGARYIWEQRAADPVTGMVVNAMHFIAPDGRALRDAFVYRWRLWSLPELRDALGDSGFTDIRVYDRLADAVTDDDELLLRPVDDGAELDETYVVYLAARLGPAGSGAADGGSGTMPA